MRQRHRHRRMHRPRPSQRKIEKIKFQIWLHQTTLGTVRTATVVQYQKVPAPMSTMVRWMNCDGDFRFVILDEIGVNELKITQNAVKRMNDHRRCRPKHKRKFQRQICAFQFHRHCRKYYYVSFLLRVCVSLLRIEWPKGTLCNWITISWPSLNEIEKLNGTKWRHRKVQLERSLEFYRTQKHIFHEKKTANISSKK